MRQWPKGFGAGQQVVGRAPDDSARNAGEGSAYLRGVPFFCGDRRTNRKPLGLCCKHSALRQPGTKSSPKNFSPGSAAASRKSGPGKSFGAGLSGGSGLRPLPAPVIPKPSIPEITIMSDNGRFCPGYPKTAGIPKPCSISA